MIPSSLLVAVLAAAFIAVFVSDRPAYDRLLEEDGAVEYATSVLLAGAAALFAVAAWQRRRGDARYFLATLSVLLLIAAMDEISWGQRIFDVPTPQFFVERSDQEEINIHNVLQQSLAVRTKHVVGLGLLVYGVILPWVLKFKGLTLGGLGRFVIVPPVSLSGAMLIGVLFMADVPTGNEEEIGEFLLSLCLCAFAGHEAARARRSRSALPPAHSTPERSPG